MYVTPLDTKCINIKSSDSEFDLVTICFFYYEYINFAQAY